MPKKRYKNSRERFLEVGEARTNAVLERLRILGNCSNRQLYKYTPEEINRIFKTIEKELQDTKQRFLIQAKPKKTKFKL